MKWLRALQISFLVAAAAMAFLLAGCPAPPTPPPQPPPANPVSCLRACENLFILSCQNGDACYEVCRRVNNPALNACLAAAKSCEQADECDI